VLGEEKQNLEIGEADAVITGGVEFGDGHGFSGLESGRSDQ
jgi:hypothetical protein